MEHTKHQRRFRPRKKLYGIFFRHSHTNSLIGLCSSTLRSSLVVAEEEKDSPLHISNFDIIKDPTVTSSKFIYFTCGTGLVIVSNTFVKIFDTDEAVQRTCGLWRKNFDSTIFAVRIGSPKMHQPAVALKVFWKDRKVQLGKGSVKSGHYVKHVQFLEIGHEESILMDARRGLTFRGTSDKVCS